MVGSLRCLQTENLLTTPQSNGKITNLISLKNKFFVLKFRNTFFLVLLNLKFRFFLNKLNKKNFLLNDFKFKTDLHRNINSINYYLFRLLIKQL